jgi:hypothetical protein
MSDTTPDTQPDGFFQGKIGSVFFFAGPPPATLGFDRERMTIYLPEPVRFGDRVVSTEAEVKAALEGTRFEYVDKLPADATPCADFRACLAGLWLEPIAGLTNLANGEIVTGEHMPMLEPAR